MDDFQQAFSHHPQWLQPHSTQRAFELRSEEGLFATLEFYTDSGSLARGVTSAGAWSFKRVGFFQSRVTVRRDGEETDLAVYRPNWSGVEGRVQFTEGQEYVWKAANFWATQYGFYMHDKTPLVVFKPGVDHAKITDIFRFQSRVEIAPLASGLAETPILTLLGWYLMILQTEDAAAVAASSAASASAS